MTLSFQDARHLLARTGFGGDPSEIKGLMTMDREAAVESLLSGTKQLVLPARPETFWPPFLHRRA
jgi:hypothetical protein